jgi:light-regulated signal transduction histidine kinase (bacteriophytochrome)
MAELIEDLLNLSRITRRDMRKAPLDLTALARSIAEELQAAEPKRRVTFLIQDHMKAEGDRGLLRIALENLLGNAWKFTSKRPKAIIEFGRVEQEGKPTYFVRDNGAGFDMAYADKLFGAFQRLHSMSEFEGTGIGLATVQRIIHRHGGEVWAEAGVEKGATFYFTL